MSPQTTNFLFVDDSTFIPELLKKNLLEAGFTGTMYKAFSFDEAVKILNANAGTERKVEFIISDWNMPGKTGMDLLKFVRGHESYKDLPFLMLTAENDFEHMKEAVKAGSSNYQVKPWSVEELKKKIVDCLAKHKNAGK